MADIFLSYRRQDSQSATGRLADRLEAHFGADRVFHDIESIPLGDDFAATIRRAIRSATVLLVMVGPDWLAASASDGRPRLDDSADFVRLEIEAAFAQGIAVVPVLVDDARMPTAPQLPASLAPFARCEAIELSTSRWQQDSRRLIEQLQSRFAIESNAVAANGQQGGPAGIGAPARFGLDLLELLTHPTRLIARRQTGHALDALRALVFLALCIGLGNLALMIGFDGPPGPGRRTGVGAVLAWLAVGTLLHGLLAGALSATLALAWRLAGVRVDLRRVALVVAFVYSGAWLGFSIDTLLLASGVQLGDTNVLERMFERLYAPRPDGAVDVTAPERWRDVEAMLTRAFAARGALPVAVFGMSIWLATLAWVAVAWGAFRAAFDVGRLRATLATAIWFALLAGLVALAARLG
ncbi:MAG: toll/interleukin-1 receptor domain-containing protein [Burkholderiaceae bacterium]